MKDWCHDPNDQNKHMRGQDMNSTESYDLQPGTTEYSSRQTPKMILCIKKSPLFWIQINSWSELKLSQNDSIVVYLSLEE